MLQLLNNGQGSDLLVRGFVCGITCPAIVDYLGCLSNHCSSWIKGEARISGQAGLTRNQGYFRACDSLSWIVNIWCPWPLSQPFHVWLRVPWSWESLFSPLCTIANSELHYEAKASGHLHYFMLLGPPSWVNRPQFNESWSCNKVCKIEKGIFLWNKKTTRINV